MAKLRSWANAIANGAFTLIFGASALASNTPRTETQSIASRVATVRTAIARQSDEAAAQSADVGNVPDLRPVSQWGNWGNWNNWGNWANFNNWGNWANWINWPNG